MECGGPGRGQHAEEGKEGGDGVHLEVFCFNLEHCDNLFLSCGRIVVGMRTLRSKSTGMGEPL